MNSMLCSVKEFGKDLPDKDRNFAADRAQKEAPSVKEEKTAEIKTVIPEEFRPKDRNEGSYRFGWWTT